LRALREMRLGRQNTSYKLALTVGYDYEWYTSKKREKTFDWFSPLISGYDPFGRLYVFSLVHI